jgi:hypothetical protein
MNRATSIITGASASRQAVADLFAFAYQDSGYEKELMDGVLDAPAQMPAGAHHWEERTARRNAVRPQLVGREGGAS